MRRASLVLALSLAACAKDRAETTDAGPAAVAAATDAAASSPFAAIDGPAVIKGACLSCHTGEMLAQQRLTETQWTKVVTKMVGWGAPLEPAEVAPLVTYLAATYGPDAGVYVPDPVTPDEAVAELAPQDDAPVPAGDPVRGRPLFLEKCAGCHGADARGSLGVRLIDRPILYRAADFTKTIRRGRGKMLPIPLAEAEVSDVLAHLRALKTLPP